MNSLGRLLLLSLFALLVTGRVYTAESGTRVPAAIVPPAAAEPVAVAATPERIRFVAPRGVVRLRVEVYDEFGRKAFDTEQSGGNVLDWHLQDGAGQRLAPGSYACLVTIRDLAGAWTQRLAAVEVSGESASVRQARRGELPSAQAEAVGPLGDEPAVTIVPPGEPAAAAFVAHDGRSGQVVSTTGALSFRLGDFFAGADREAMNLSGEGLTVEGDLRVKGGIRFDDGTVLSTGQKTRVGADGKVAADVAGTGTAGRLPKWADSSGTLTDSIVAESAGNLGIGLGGAPQQKLHVFGKALFQNSGTAAVFIVDRTDGKIGALGAGGVSTTFAYDNSGIFKIESNSRSTIAQGIFGTGATTRLVIDADGEVGIGVDSASAKLDVNGAVNAATQYNLGGQRVLSRPGTQNIFVGANAAANNATPGQSNTFMGHYAGGSISSMAAGSYNSFFGAGAGYAATGSQNSFFGLNAGGGSGSGNSFFGVNTGVRNDSGSYNTALGHSADVGVDGLTNATAIGSRAFVSQSNSLVLGSINGVNDATASTNVGIGVTTPKSALHVAGGNVFIAQPNSLIITSPNGGCWFVKVSDAGALSTVSVSCP